ncbi:MAG: CvpA family protein [Clostridia bacterium]|nr:CvpA family protein [Clostridia bacterium]
MNIVDLFIFVILGVFVITGMYKGFVRSCMNILATVGTFIVTLIVYPLFAKLMFLSNSIVKNFRFYAEGTEKLAELECGNLLVSTLSQEQMAKIVSDSVAKQNTGLRPPMDSAVLKNLTSARFAGSFETVGEYFNETIVHYAINMVCFLLVFFLIKILVDTVLSMYDKSDKIPRLRQYDTVFGGVAGFIEGILIFFIIFSVVPLIYNLMTIKPIEDLLANSLMGNLFIGGNFIPKIIRSVV